MSKRDEYVAQMKRRLDEWSAEMDTLEAKAQAAQLTFRTSADAFPANFRGRARKGFGQRFVGNSASMSRSVSISQSRRSFLTLR
jgi:hypothetical protein